MADNQTRSMLDTPQSQVGHHDRPTMAIQDAHSMRRMVATNGTTLHVMTRGQGFPVVLLHGFPQTSYEWRHILPILGQRFRVIAPDLRGIGDSVP
jgi:alpha-beta hydrolase superfamily lysophospholipase